MPAHVREQMNGALSLGSWCGQWQSCLETGGLTRGAASPFPTRCTQAEKSFADTGSALEAGPPGVKLCVTSPECLLHLDPEDTLCEKLALYWVSMRSSSLSPTGTNWTHFGKISTY